MKTFITILVVAIIGLGAYMLGKQNNPSTIVVVPEEEVVVVVNQEPIQESEDANNNSEEGTLQNGQCPGFVVTSPTVGDTVTFPLTITGTVHPTSNPGPWTIFEGEAGSVRIQDTNGGVRSAIIPLSLNVPWMNSDPKPFSVTIPELTSTPYTNTVHLVFQDNNVAGPGEGQTHTCYLGVHVAL